MEFTVEAGRPDSMSEAKIACMKRFGVTRVSVNPQTMQERTLRRIGRHHTPEDIVRMFRALREAGSFQINMDLILGLPGETAEDVADLRAGDYVYLTGTIYTARDAAHKRMYEALQKGESLPLDVKDNVIYYMGPSPAREGRPIGSAGPTTASRMDKYAPTLLDLGLKGMVGKGKRSPEVKAAIVRNGAVYFAAVGGAGALLSKSIVESEVIAYDDLGTEAIRKLRVENFPVIVVIDPQGNNLYETAIQEYRTIAE